MPDQSNRDADKLITWSRQQLQKAVDHLMRAGIFEQGLLETKPAWTFPYSIVIGQVREQGESHEFFWIICGDAPIDYVKSAVAATPRDAARHFAMKWQLDAARNRDPQARQHLHPDSGGDWDTLCDTLESRAVALFELVADDRLWMPAAAE
jgi:hypothetical protein